MYKRLWQYYTAMGWMSGAIEPTIRVGKILASTGGTEGDTPIRGAVARAI